VLAQQRESFLFFASLKISLRAKLPITELPHPASQYTRAQIAQIYAAHRKGAYAGREAEWARIDADIIRAAAEGRVLGPDYITK
jgi:hypothetical protein